MRVTRRVVAEKLAAYLRHELSERALVAWAEQAMLDGNFDLRDVAVLRDIVGRLGLADVRAFGLTWDDIASSLERLGYTVRVAVEAKA